MTMKAEKKVRPKILKLLAPCKLIKDKVDSYRRSGGDGVRWGSVGCCRAEACCQTCCICSGLDVHPWRYMEKMITRVEIQEDDASNKSKQRSKVIRALQISDTQRPNCRTRRSVAAPAL